MREKLHGFHGFLMNHESFPNEQCSSSNTNDAKTALHLDEIQ